MRFLRALLIMLAVLCVLLVASDRIAVRLAESEAERRVKSAQGFTAEPDVSIKGFPFLTQVAARKLESVRVIAEDARAGTAGRSLRISRLSVDLRDVRLADNYRSAVADTASGTVLIGYRALSDMMPPGVSVSYAGKDPKSGAGELKTTFRLSFLGRTFERKAVSEVRLKGKKAVSLRAKSIPSVGVPGFEDFVRKQIDFSQTVTGLPAGIDLDRLSVGPDGVTVALSGEDVALTGQPGDQVS